jgi:hypothetical protein
VRNWFSNTKEGRQTEGVWGEREPRIILVLKRDEEGGG